ncbi:MAG: hypothetical protein HY763_11970 [Planctomycetes bacterium]|nr:hypothetical protein [Planctomycetota bacterium]
MNEKHGNGHVRPTKVLVILGAATIVVSTLPLGCAPGGRVDPDAPRRSRLFRPTGAPWTILCLEMQGPQRMDHITQVAETLKQTPGVRARDVFVRDEAEGVARLYYGTYYRRTDPKTGKRNTPRQLTEDLRLIKELGSGPGEYYFLRALTVRMPTPDAGNPAWRLDRADGVYSLQVAVFEPTDEFWEYKQAAAEYCAMLRERGFEAYYYHTPAASMVTVGLFGADAVIEQPGKLPSYSPQVLALQQSDELMKYNRLNGAVYRGQVYTSDAEKGERMPVPSRLVHIPRDGERIRR